MGEHQDVGKVEQGAQDAHQHCQPPVDWRIEVLKMYDFLMQWFFEFVTLIAEKSHIVMSEGVALMPAIAVLLTTSTITACVVVEKFPKISFDKLAEV